MARLKERCVTRATEALELSQPSLSSSLARLRRHFNDELLHRVGNRYELTPLATQLSDRTTAALAGVQRVFDSSPDFDPATSEREFTVVMSDYDGHSRYSATSGCSAASAFSRCSSSARFC